MHRVRVEIIADSPECVPTYASEHAAGMDLKANEDCQIDPGARRAVSTGIRLALPEGYEAQVRPRSGLALLHGISIPNAPGTIDADYRGELKVILINHGSSPFQINKGDRIAQLVVAPVCRAELIESQALPASARGDGGFGSTGK